jgi:hypothetical protein
MRYRQALLFEKRSKNFFYRPGLTAHLASPVHGTIGKSFCFFFQKEALASLPLP